ncbi:hypothetical protein ACFQFQ_14765 [Sulfitobacter porphyrae]|uniref:Uncharacterized protein n=1 Tax=Sulfitobacter porphyrae TaxID=1246864 RepID=A0ABW2B4C3_9RHOB
MIRRILTHLRRKADDAAIKQAMFKAQRNRDRIKREEQACASELYGDAREYSNDLPDRVRRFDGDVGEAK